MGLGTVWDRAIDILKEKLGVHIKSAVWDRLMQDLKAG